MITFIELTSTEYQNITPVNDALYFITDSQQIILNNTTYNPSNISYNGSKFTQLDLLDLNGNIENQILHISLPEATNENIGGVYLLDEIISKENSFTEENPTAAVTAQAVRNYVDSQINCTKLTNCFKPQINNATNDEEYGEIGDLSNNNTIQFNHYFADGINEIHLWCISNVDGIATIKINDQNYQININTTLQKTIIKLTEKIIGKINIQQLTTHNLKIVDWTMCSYNIESQWKPYIFETSDSILTINANNGLNQYCKNFTNNISFYSSDIYNLQENEIIKIMFNNANNKDIIINGQNIDSLTTIFYVMFINIDGEIKQIGNIIQVE